MRRFSIKFFGTKDRKKRVEFIKTTIEATHESDIETILRQKYGFLVINGLKIREIKDC